MKYLSCLVRLMALFFVALQPAVVHADDLGEDVDIRYGVKFNAHNEVMGRRTSIKVEPIEIDDYFKVEFDMAIRNNKFGYISRVIINESTNVDLLIGTPTVKTQRLYLTIGNAVVRSWEYPYVEPSGLNWEECSLEFLPRSDSVRFRGESFYLKFAAKSSVQVLFGANKFSKFATQSVASIALKDLTLWRKRSEPLYSWPFKEHGDDILYDEVEQEPLTVTNAEWIIDEHATWRHNFRCELSPDAVAVYDEDDGIYIVSNDSLSHLSLVDFSRKGCKLQRSINLTRKSFAKLKDMFVVDKDGGLQLFDINDRKRAMTYSKFNFEENRWEPHPNIKTGRMHTNCNLFISPIDSSLNQLFGYGFYKYYTTHYTYKDGEVTSRDLSDKIEPRYLSATGMVGNSLFILGGYGNKSGMQEAAPHSYHDLYEFDIERDSIMKIDMGDALYPDDEIVGTNLVFPNGRDKAYALFHSPIKFDTSLKLKQIDIESQTLINYADSICYSFVDVESQARLVYLRDEQQFVAYTVHQLPNNNVELNVYSISYPVLHRSEMQQLPLRKLRGREFVLYISIAIVLLIVCGCLSIKRRSRDKRRVILSGERSDLLVMQRAKPLQTGIYMLGGFQVINRAGEDITATFSPLMVQLMSLIILASERDGKGISNVVLKDYLWLDKSEDSARNNRGVTIRRIRLLLEQVGGFTLTPKGGFWIFESGDNDFCNYAYALRYLRSIDEKEELSREELITLIEIAHMGNLLPNQDFNFFDNYKAEYASLIIDILRRELELQGDDELRYLLADSLLIFDSVDEQAIRIKCQALIAKGQLGTARKSYNNFVREYNLLLGEKFQDSFETFIK